MVGRGKCITVQVPAMETTRSVPSVRNSGGVSPRPVSSMSVGAELMRTQSVSTMPSHQCRSRGRCAPRLFPMCPPFNKERWHGGQVKAHLSAIGGPQGPPASGSKSSKGLGAASNDPTLKQLRHPFTHSLAQSSRSRPALPRCTQPLTLAPRIKRSSACTVLLSSMNTAGFGKIQSHPRSSPLWGNGRSRA